MKNSEVKTISLAHIAGFRVPDWLQFVKTHKLDDYMPTSTSRRSDAKHEIQVMLPWIRNVCNTLRPAEVERLVEAN